MFTPSYIVGILGLLFILAGWLITIKTIPPVKLSGLYSIGSMLLAFYSYLVGDPIFIILNILAVSVSGAQFIRGLNNRTKEKMRVLS